MESNTDTAVTTTHAEEFIVDFNGHTIIVVRDGEVWTVIAGLPHLDPVTAIHVNKEGVLTDVVVLTEDVTVGDMLTLVNPEAWNVYLDAVAAGDMFSHSMRPYQCPVGVIVSHTVA